MKVIDLSGKNYHEAVTHIEKTIGEALPDEVKEKLMDHVGVGGTFADLQLADMGEKYDKTKFASFKDYAEARLDEKTNGGKTSIRGEPFTTDAESPEEFRARIVAKEGPQAGREWDDFLRRHGPIPAYNGVMGDSHDCPACNFRREGLKGEPGDIDYLHDMEAGLTPSQSKAAVEAGYARRGIPVPADAINTKKKYLEARGATDPLDLLVNMILGAKV